MGRIKYYNQDTGQWEYADTVFVAGGSGGGSVVEQVQADMDENDPTSPAYVKNRTHYKGELVVVELEDLIQCGNAGEAPFETKPMNDGRYLHLNQGFPLSTMMEVGKTYTIDADGTVYTGVGVEATFMDIPCVAISDYSNLEDFGNELYEGATADGDFIFLTVDGVLIGAPGTAMAIVGVKTTSETLPTSIKLCTQEQTIVRLPMEYLPEGYGFVGENGEVNKFADKYLRQPDYHEDNADSASFIKNKPFDGIHYKYTGSIDDYELSTIMSAFKVSDRTISREDLVGITVYASYEQIPEYTITENDVAMAEGGILIAHMRHGDAKIQAIAVLPVGYGNDTAGTYVVRDGDTPIIKEFKYIKKQIDEIFIPDSIARKSEMYTKAEIDAMFANFSGGGSYADAKGVTF